MKKRRRPSVRSLVLLALAALAALSLAFPSWYYHLRTWTFFGTDVWRVVDGADRVEVFRLRPIEGSALRRIGPLPTIGEAVVPDRRWVERLRSLLWNSFNYPYEIFKPCAPRPGVAVRFHRQGDQVDLLICFECDMLSLARSGQAKWEDFDPVRADWVRLVRPVFPADEAIQALR